MASVQRAQRAPADAAAPSPGLVKLGRRRSWLVQPLSPPAAELRDSIGDSECDVPDFVAAMQPIPSAACITPPRKSVPAVAVSPQSDMWKQLEQATGLWVSPPRDSESEC